MARRRKFWGWGYEDEPIRKDQKELFAAMAHGRFPDLKLEDLPEPRIEDIDLRLGRVRAPESLAHLFSADRYDRAAHTYGKSTRDIIRGAEGDFAEPPDLVAHPASEADVVAILEWAVDAGVAAVPYGGGTSV
ncbi:MAG: FAD-binding protein, partial [Myxococcales bacterium]|nr:FAD-binding protein [Myxococcales bacterium]